MANNYRAFCQELAFSDDPALHRQEEDWLISATEYEDTDADQLEAKLKFLGLDTSGLDLQLWPDFQCDVEQTSAFFYTEESGNIDHVAIVVQGFIRKFCPKGVWSMEWADYCNRARPGEFGGGIVVVTADTIVIKSTGSMRDEILESLNGVRL